MKMCFHTGKATFCAGFGAQMLANVSATGGRIVNVINGRGRGSKLQDIASCPIPKHGAHTVVVAVAAVNVCVCMLGTLWETVV